MYYIYKETESGNLLWNPKVKRFQRHGSKSCVYKSFKGALRMSREVMIRRDLSEINVCHAEEWERIKW